MVGRMANVQTPYDVDLHIGIDRDGVMEAQSSGWSVSQNFYVGWIEVVKGLLPSSNEVAHGNLYRLQIM